MTETDKQWAEGKIHALSAAIETMAQTAHQAYHLDVPTSWRGCPKDLCKQAQRALGVKR